MDREIVNEPGPEKARDVEVVLLKRTDLERMFKLTNRSIQNLINSGELPPALRIGKSYRWRLDDINRYLDQKRDGEGQELSPDRRSGWDQEIQDKGESRHEISDTELGQEGIYQAS